MILALAVDLMTALVVIAVGALLAGEGLAFLRRWRGANDQSRPALSRGRRLGLPVIRRPTAKTAVHRA